MDDMGLPIADGPGEFARAFIAATRHRDERPIQRSSPAFVKDSDDLGFPAASDPADFAGGFDVTWGRLGKSLRRAEERPPAR